MSHPRSHIFNAIRRGVDFGSLQTRLTAGVVLASLVGIGSMAAWMGWRMQQIMLESHRQRTAIVAERLEEDVRYYAEVMPPQTALEKVVDYRATGDLAIWVTTANGQVLTQSETLTMGSWQTSGVASTLLDSDIPPGTDIMPVGDWRLMVRAEPIAIAGLPPTMLYIAEDATADHQGFQQLLRMLLLTSLLLVSLLALAFGVYIRRTLSPIRQLNRLASAVTADTLGDYQLTLEAAPTEVQELARTYNLMLTRLSKAWIQQKRFVNDISHELRTPLSLVQGYLESILRRGQNLTPPQREGLEIATVETSRTIHLLTELLDLARLDNGQMPLNLELTDLKDVINEAIAMAEADYFQDDDAGSRVIVETTVPGPLAKADRARLRTVLVELLDNALRYSAPQQPIRVLVSEQNGWATIQVQDQGQGIPPSCQPDIFNPFYRVDENRSRTTGGTGLGLTLVRSLVEAMAGKVSVQSGPNQGCLFTISLPT
ncbi:MAG: ATP-binding protein [Nodosilinea sp.]